LYLCIRRVIKQTAVIIEAYHFCQLYTTFYPTSCCEGWLQMHRKLLGIVHGFQRNRSANNYIFCICQILEKKWENNEAVRQLYIDLKKAHNSFRRAVLYNILIEFDIPIKLLSLMKMCLNETYSRVRVGKHLSDVSY